MANGTPLSATDRDTVIRTIIGEAANEGSRGWAAVAHVIRNRQYDTRYPNSAHAVARQPRQFSAWNSKGRMQGNDLVRTRGPDTKIYQQVGQVVDRVYSGQVADETGGAVNYYAPQGMPGGRAPGWWGNATGESGGYRTIGNHRFAGKVNSTKTPPVSESAVAIESGKPVVAVSGNGATASTGVRRRIPMSTATGSSNLFPGFSKTVTAANDSIDSVLKQSLFENVVPGRAPVGVFDSLFKAYDNG